MKKITTITLVIATSFCFGFAVKSVTTPNNNSVAEPGKVTGIGGVFFKCKEPKKVKEWYAKNLGVTMNPYGGVFEWYEGFDSTKKAMTQWTPFSETTKYFDPSTKDFMINYRVKNLEQLVEQLRKDGVTIVDKMETYDFGKFIHIMDIEGNKVELWEPK